MPAISNLLARFGYVKLARYGLLLTPEDRIMSLRPAVLADGLGGRIVGWPDGDLAAMELEKWETVLRPARPASLPVPATRVAVAPPPLPRITPPRAAIPVAVTAAPVVPTPAVAEPEQVDEDDWEWEIALARARVAAEEVEQVAKAATVPRVTIPPRPDPIEVEDRTEVRTSNLPAVPPPVTRPMSVAVIPPKRPATAPPTVIPIPKLPALKERLPQIQPVVASSGVPARTRFAKGTGPVEPPRPARAGSLPGLPRLRRS